MQFFLYNILYFQR